MLSRELDKRHRLVKAQSFELMGGQRLSHYRFRHYLFQLYLYHRLDEMERAYMHEQVGRAIEALFGERLELVAVQLARHFQEAGLVAEAVDYLGQAADRARRLFALEEAIQLYSRAIDLARDHPQSIDQQTFLRFVELRGECYSLAGHFESAAADLLLILQVVREEADRRLERAVLLRLGWAFRRADIHDKAFQHLNDALDISRALGDQRAVADALFHLGTLVWDAGNNKRAHAYHQEAADICRQLGLTDLVTVQALHGLAETSWMAGEPDTAISLFTESLSLARQLGDKSYESENLQMIGFASTGAMGIGNYSKAIDSLSQALTISESTGLAWHSLINLHGLGYAQGCRGDYEGGLAAIHRSLIMSEDLGVTRLRTISLEFLGDLLLDLNLQDAAAEPLKVGIEMSLHFNSEYWLPRLQTRLAICRLRQGDLNVESDLQEALEMARGNWQGLHVTQALEGLAELSLARGEVELASKYAGELLTMAEKKGMREMVARAYRWRGEVLLAWGQLKEAEKALKQANELASEIGRVRLEWDVHEALHLLYKMRGRDELAREHENTVQSIVKQIGENLQQAEMRAGLPS
jgi:tetratricopeptide (TPR) repeat protein